ncbi:hypothetical protein NEOC84_000886|uniref:hypothetical protein n=1 Tax=Neochlamydia sp. AcF84 TaxID=2315858 RepID=UPI0014084C12|nr:hypothetical protein [Neochlamydia sp. AcF84]NGY94982.1 hypothetical protein [Neochlamydia sp. AcF84]
MKYSSLERILSWYHDEKIAYKELNAYSWGWGKHCGILQWHFGDSSSFIFNSVQGR